jgi:hypothetical protein
VGGAVSSRILQDMWAFLIATAIRPTLFVSAARQRCFVGNRGVFDERSGCWNKAPGPPRVSYVSGGQSQTDSITPTVVGLFSRAPRRGSGWRE